MNRAIANHLKALIASRPYAGTVAGIVTPVVVKRGRKSVTYAIDKDVLGLTCEEGDLTVLCPDASKQSIFYFEDRQGVSVRKKEGRFVYYQCTLTLVGWLNLDKLGYSALPDTCAWGVRVYRDVLGMLPPENTSLDAGGCSLLGLSMNFERQHPRGAEIFSRYSFGEEFNQFTLPPSYDYFAIDIHCEWRTVSSCLPELPDPSPVACPPTPAGRIVTVNGEASKTKTILVLSDGVPVGEFDPVSGIVEIECGGPPAITTVNGVASDVPDIHVQQGGVDVGTLDPATGIHTVPECPPSLPGTVNLKNSEGTVLDTIDVPCGATVEAVAPDGVVTIKNSGGIKAGTLDVPSGGAKDALIADYAIELRDTNGTLIGWTSFPYGTTGQVTAPDGSVQPRDSGGAPIGGPVAVLSGGSVDVPIGDSTITLPDGQTKSVKATQPYTVPLTAPLKFSFSPYDQGSDLWTVTTDEAGTYDTYSQDGSSGTITYSKNGGAFTALSGTITLAVGDTIQVKRTTITAAGWSRWQRLVTP